MKSTFYACAVAFEQNPDVAKAAVQGGHEVCSHGYRWEEVFRLSEEEERARIRNMDVAVIEIENPVELYLFEVYAALELRTALHNSFRTH